jgi:serine/threonine-protein kinase HipA
MATRKTSACFCGPGGRFRLTPFYDVLTAQPSLDARQIRHKGFRLAMSPGNSGHYRIHDIRGRHFVEAAQRARLPRSLAERAIERVLAGAAAAFEAVERVLPRHFSAQIHGSVRPAATARLRQLKSALR